MNNIDGVPVFEACFPDLQQFITELVQAYASAELTSWDHLDKKVRAFFTPERMEQMESQVPGWKKMASYSDGITLVHVMCVFLGLVMLPEFQALIPRQKQLAKWIVLFHDIDKFHIQGQKDTMHAFRSAVETAKALPRFGFPTRPYFHERINYWSEYTAQAYILPNGEQAPKPDNRKLPGILIGIDNLFGKDTPAALITKTVLLHISLHIDPFYPTPSALTEEEIKRYINYNLFLLLKAMMLADNEGWSLFDAETREQRSRDAMQAFEKIERMISE
ncbi:MAG TPA: hypothetical protein VFG81_02195 [Anaerolineales bacterium]|jgi:hypothetical protein|nr:hypothetical protein [Anaerolineales bacterium]